MAADEWNTKRRRTSHEGWEGAGGAGGGARASSKHGLFDEPEHREVDRRLERAIAELTLEMLEAVRLSPRQLLHILEHPRCAEYLVGAYVRYPDLEEMENGDVDEVNFPNIPPLPAQITKLIPRAENLNVTIDGEQYSVEYDFAIIQYTQRNDGSLKIRKGQMLLPLVQKAPFTLDELTKWQGLLNLFSGRQGYEKLQSLPLILPATAAKLKSFTFTNDDVDLVLRRKFRDDESPYAHIASLNFRDLYLRKSELEFNIKGREDELQEITSDEAVEALKEEIEKLKSELKVVIEYVAMHEKSEKGVGPGETKLSTASGAAGRDALNVAGLSQETSWKQHEWVKLPRTLCWRQPMSYLDVLYPIANVPKKALDDRIESWIRKTKAADLAARFTRSAAVGRQLALQVEYVFPGAGGHQQKAAEKQPVASIKDEATSSQAPVNNQPAESAEPPPVLEIPNIKAPMDPADHHAGSAPSPIILKAEG